MNFMMEIELQLMDRVGKIGREVELLLVNRDGVWAFVGG